MMPDRDINPNWPDQIPVRRYRSEDDDFGWEPGESVLPAFRKPDVHLTRREIRRMRRENMEPPDAPEYRIGGGLPYDWAAADTRDQWSEQTYFGYGPSGYQRSDDRIFDDLAQRLLLHGQIDARDIVLEVHDGVVTLRGIVDTIREKHMAEVTVESVMGVIQVNNDLKVREMLRRRGEMEE